MRVDRNSCCASSTVTISGKRCALGVITSYSIHYTKLYDSASRVLSDRGIAHVMIVADEEAGRLVNEEEIKLAALKNVEQNGIVFLA